MSSISFNSNINLKLIVQSKHSGEPLPLESFLNPQEKDLLRSTTHIFQNLFSKQTSANTPPPLRGIDALSTIDSDTLPYNRTVTTPPPPQEFFDKWSKIIIENQVEINQPLNRNSRRGTILHFCAKLGFLTPLIPVIFQCGIDPSIREKNILGNTALLRAIANASNENAMELIKLSPLKVLNMQSTTPDDEEEVEVLDNSALHLAVGKGYEHYDSDSHYLTYTNYELMEALVTRGAHVNLKNCLGNTPLHLACIRRDPKMIRYLLAHGARIDIVNNQGKTPKDLLSLNYNEARESLNKQVVVFTLSNELFEGSLGACIQCFLQILAHLLA